MHPFSLNDKDLDLIGAAQGSLGAKVPGTVISVSFGESGEMLPPIISITQVENGGAETTLAIGEEGGGAETTLAIGEEGGGAV